MIMDDCDTLNLTDRGVRVCKLQCRGDDSLGLSLSRSQWDPYPWVGAVTDQSEAAKSGIRVGDCLLEVNGQDVLGMRIVEVAEKLKCGGEASVVIWNPGLNPECSPETLCCGPMPTNLRRLTSFLSNVLSALECPVCLETISPPVHQCANGHLICTNCRVRTDVCPICRLKLFRGRSLLAEQVFTFLIDAFELNHVEENQRSKVLVESLFGKKLKKRRKAPSTLTNKFLTRIVGSGKSSSVENLTKDNFLSPDSTSGLKMKSLSSGELLFVDSTPPSRTSSTRSLQRSSRSCHGSTSDLKDFTIEIRNRSTVEVECQTEFLT